MSPHQSADFDQKSASASTTGEKYWISM